MGVRTFLSRNKGANVGDFGFDEDIQLIFFSEAFGSSPQVGDALSKELNSYKQTVFNKLLDYSKSWSSDHEIMFNTILEEKFAMANTVKYANLEIERVKEASNLRLEAYKEVKERNKHMENKIAEFERFISAFSGSLGGDARLKGEISKL